MLLEIAIALITAKILNYLFEKIKQPGVVGEIIAGIILGPCCIGLLSGSSINIFGNKVFELNFNLSTAEFKELAFIGIVFLLFIIGLETEISDIKKTGKLGFYTAIFSLSIPFIFGFILGLFFEFDLMGCMVIGAILFATSVTISMRILQDLNLISSRVGLTLQTAGIISDVIGLFIFSLIIGQGNPIIFFIRILIFLIFIFLIGILFLKYAVKKGVTRNSTKMLLPVGLIICFLFAALAEDMGLAAIIGAFAAGLIIKRTPQGGMITNHIKTIGNALFIPLFFVWIGASFDFNFILSSGHVLMPIIFIILFVIFGLSGNFLGGAIGAKIAGLTKKESISVGISMMPIMGMALIIVSTSTDRGIFGDPSGVLAQQIKTATLLLIIVSCLITPTILKKNIHVNYMKKEKNNNFKEYFSSMKQKTPKIYYNKKSEQLIKVRKVNLNFLLGAIYLQFFLILFIFKAFDFYSIAALFGSIIGSYIGYITLRFLLTRYDFKKLNKIG